MLPRLASSSENLKVLAVTKGKNPLEIMKMLEETGLQSIGENRLEEAESKFLSLPKSLEKHFIGKLQSRKIKKIVELFDVIQSVESFEQAKKISAQGKVIKIFLQINLSGLPGRSGVDPNEAIHLLKEIRTLPNIVTVGVMGMASIDPKKARQEFKLLKKIQVETGLPECSMGMSSDYQTAIEEGSTLLRLGRILFTD